MAGAPDGPYERSSTSDLRTASASLASRAELSPATLSRVIDLLERDAVLTTDDRGGVADLDWTTAIRRWSQDYQQRRSNTVTTYLDPRGLSAVAEKLETMDLPYAVTASLAAQRFAPVAPTRVAVVYVEEPLAAAARLKLRLAEAGAKARTADAVNALAQAGILRPRQVGRRRYRVFEAADVLDLFTGLERALASPTGDTAVVAPAHDVPRQARHTKPTRSVGP